MMKKLISGFGIFVGVIFILWVAIIFPYPSYTTKQIEVMKQELIDGILLREIKLRELYAKANEKEFIQTEEFKQQLQKEKEKFYKYCDNDGATEYKNEHCEITGYTHWDIFGRIPNRTLKYHFDEESQVFFNKITTYWRHKKERFSSTMFGTHWEDRFWFPFEEDPSILLYPVKIVGYSSDYSFQNSSDRPYGYLRGMEDLKLASGEAVSKENLILIKSKSIYYESISSDRGRHKNVSFNNIKTYIQMEKK